MTLSKNAESIQVDLRSDMKREIDMFFYELGIDLSTSDAIRRQDHRGALLACLARINDKRRLLETMEWVLMKKDEYMKRKPQKSAAVPPVAAPQPPPPSNDPSVL